MQRQPSDSTMRRLLRATHQNAVLVAAAFVAGFGGLFYSTHRIALWVAGGVLLAVAIANLVCVIRTNRRSIAHTRPF